MQCRVGQVGSLACGDALKLFLKVDPETEKIEKAKVFNILVVPVPLQCFCSYELVVGKTLDEALAVTK
jgi:NifU-like protein